jgi:hypothetical protein
MAFEAKKFIAQSPFSCNIPINLLYALCGTLSSFLGAVTSPSRITLSRGAIIRWFVFVAGVLQRVYWYLPNLWHGSTTQS